MGKINRRKFLGLTVGTVGAIVAASTTGYYSPLTANVRRPDQQSTESEPGPMSSHTSSPVPAPTTGAYWGVLQYNIPYDLSAWDELEASVEKSMSVVQFGWPWYDSGGEMAFPKGSMDTIRGRSAIPCINWCSWQLGGGADQPDFQCRNITDGRYDDFIRRFAADVAAWGEPLIIRFNHEMNIGGQFPWNFHSQGNTAEEFVEMWRHVHSIFRDEGATNAAWFWCPNVWWPGSWAIDPSPGYPGDDFVDWVGVDGYNWDSMWFDEIFRHAYDSLTQLAPDKPVALGEWATHEGAPIDKAVWIADAHQQIESNYPRMRLLLWFNEPDSGNWPIDSSPEATSAFRDAIASPYFLAGEREPVAADWTDRTRISDIADTQYVDTGLESNTWYRYRIRSESAGLSSGWSDWVQART